MGVDTDQGAQVYVHRPHRPGVGPPNMLSRAAYESRSMFSMHNLSKTPTARGVGLSVRRDQAASTW